LIVVDYKMPDMDGEKVAEEIRRVSPLTPILMYSGALEELPARALELVDEFVSKQEPFSNLLYHIRTIGLRPYRRKRFFPRYTIQLPFLVIHDESPGSAVFYGESSDLSEGGIGGTLDEELEIAVHGMVLVRIAISSDLALTARASLRHRLGHRYGFQFHDLSAAQQQIIRESLASF
jgi:CheY-like chemotaxis protein